MDEFLARGVGLFVLFTLAAWVGLMRQKFSNARDMRAMPKQRDRAELSREIRRMRSDGANIQECVDYVRSKGWRTGVARGLVLDVDREEPADVAHAKRTVWNGFEFEYPDNWRVSNLIEEAGRSQGICIEALGSGMTLLVPLNDDNVYVDMVDHQAHELVSPERTSISRFGSLAGEGVVLRGEHAKLHIPAEITVFRVEGAHTPIGVVAYHALDEADLVVPGLQLIEASLMTERALQTA